MPSVGVDEVYKGSIYLTSFALFQILTLLFIYF